MKLQDDIRISGGTRSSGTGDNQARAQELKDQMTQLTQENVTVTFLMSNSLSGGMIECTQMFSSSRDFREIFGKPSALHWEILTH